jgi:tetratricopeptide (TPR) repeat protein
MEKLTLKDLKPNFRQAFNKAKDAGKNDPEYGIELLKNIVQKKPGFIPAREALRELEKVKSESMGFVAKFMANLKSAKFIAKAKSKIKKHPLEAMKDAEEALALYLFSTGALNVLADAATAADAHFISIEALNIIMELQPNSEHNLKRLADAYKNDGNGAMHLAIRQKIADLTPDNLEAQAAVRAAAASASMQDNWEGKESFQDIMDREKNIEVQKEEITARNEDDVKDRIAELEAKLGTEDEGQELHRSLGELYLRAGEFVKAEESFQWLADALGVLDPTIDKYIERARLGLFDQKIANADPADAPALEKEKMAYRQERAEARVEKFSNDTQLRYDLAIVYFELNEVDKALEQFQLAQRNPQRRVSSKVFLGRCFHIKKHYDMGVEQFTDALKEMLVMDNEKMEALYYFGNLYEDMGNADEALKCYKEIYSSNVNYRDVKERIDKFYSNK